MLFWAPQKVDIGVSDGSLSTCLRAQRRRAGAGSQQTQARLSAQPSRVWLPGNSHPQVLLAAKLLWWLARSWLQDFDLYFAERMDYAREATEQASHLCLDAV